MNRVKQLGVLWLSALLLVAGFHIAAEDLLLFRSDPYSLSLYLIIVSALLVVVLALASLLIAAAFPKRRRRIYEIWVLLLAVAICIAFLILLLGLFRTNVRLGVLLEPYIPMWILNVVKTTALAIAPFIIIGIFVWAFMVRARFQSMIAIITNRVEVVGLCVLGYAILGILITYGTNQLVYGNTVASTEARGNHFLLIVLDGFPADYLNSYNHQADVTVLDEIIETGRVFTQVRSSAPYTSAYFATLYAGNDGANANRGNLFERLQRAGTAVRLIAYHRNGFPEGTVANIGQYRGLRSALLSHNLAWIPETLGLDYHLALRYRPAGPLAKWLLGWVTQHLNTDTKNAFERILIPQLRANRSGAEKSFLLFHVSHDFGSSAGEEALPRAEFTGAEESAIIRNIRDREYRYGPEHEHYAALVRERERINTDRVGEELRTLFERLAEDPELKDTVIMVTADHGSMAAKGRFWYAYHPNEEVIRVPLILWNDLAPGTDDRLLTSVDLTKSILDFYGIESPFNDEAVSLFDTGQHARTASLTLKSDVNDEWFLVLTDGHQKYQANIHPDGTGETTLLSVNDYNEQIEATFAAPPVEIAREIQTWLQKFQTKPQEIHPNFR